MILSQSEAKEILQKAIAASKADSCTAHLSGHNRDHVRLALNDVTTSGAENSAGLSITSSFGKRSGTVRINELTDGSIAAAVRKSEEIARLAPENPEHMPPLGAQKYLRGEAFSNATAKAGPEKLAGMCKPVLSEASEKRVVGAGFLESTASFSAMATTNDLNAYDKTTNAVFKMTARSSDGTGSGWAGNESHDIGKLDTAAMARVAVKKAFESVQPAALDPGKYTVILERAAVSDLVGAMIGRFDARSADEGRSFLSKKGGGNKLGQKLVNERVNIFSDPQHKEAPGSIFSSDGLPATKRQWIKDGVVQELQYSRYWAQKQKHQPVPYPTNVIMEGGKASVEEMMRDIRKGVLVTRFWYIREVDPETLVLTGLTRDGTFLIENGKIARPIKNFRFNESPVAMLNNVIAMTPSERTTGGEGEGAAVSVPILMVKDFTFSSLSNAV